MVSPSTPSPSPKRPISERKLAANRANAQRSTGPRTRAGKARARLNGWRHGLRSTLPPDEVAACEVLLDEAPDAFRKIRRAVMADVRPRGAVEEFLAERIARAAWRMRRADAAEHELFERAELDRLMDYHRQEAEHCLAMDPVPRTPDMEAERSAGLARPARQRADVEYWDSQIKGIDAHDADAVFPAHFARNTPAAAVAEQFRKPERESELLRITGYTTRLEGSFRAILRELRQLRKDRAKWEETGDDDDDEQWTERNADGERSDQGEPFDEDEVDDVDQVDEFERATDPPLAASQTPVRREPDAPVEVGPVGIASESPAVEDAARGTVVSTIADRKELTEGDADAVPRTDGVESSTGAGSTADGGAPGSAKPQAAGTSGATRSAPPAPPQTTARSAVRSLGGTFVSAVPRASEPNVAATAPPSRGRMSGRTGGP